MRNLAAMAACLLAVAAANAAEFTEKPSAKLVAGKAVVEFTVKGETDVAVYVEDARGRVVRHLAAGRLGASAPAPLKAGSLSQRVEWDGKDDDGEGVAAEPAGYRFRVGLGLSAAADGNVFSEHKGANTLTNVIGLACDSQGRVYVLSQRWRRAWWNGTSIHVFARDGGYLKTIKPFRADLPAAKIKTLTALRDDAARPMPTIYRVVAMSYYPHEDVPQQMVVGPDGHLHFVVVRAAYRKGPQKWIATLDADGGLPYATYTGGLISERSAEGFVHLAAAGDGKGLYATGLDRHGGKPPANTPAVFRIELPGRKELKRFFGVPASAGGGETRLADVRGVAADGKGQLLIADRGNDRIVIVRERDGGFAASLPVTEPEWLDVHPGVGAIYVRSGDAVLKLDADAARKGTARQLARLPLPKLDPRQASRARWFFALDRAAARPVLWVGLSRGGTALMRCQENADGSFGELTQADYHSPKNFFNLAVSLDRTQVLCKHGYNVVEVLDEPTGRVRRVRLAGTPGQTYRFGPKGQMYGMDHAWPNGIRRWDAGGKFLPFKATAADRTLRGKLPNRPSGTTSWERDFDVDRAGNVYVKHRGKRYHGRMRVDKYDRDGKLLGTVIWVVSDGAQGPRVDPQGNIYIAECVKPAGKAYPDFFKGKLPPTKIDKRGDVAQQYTWMYGSVIKFPPAGGSVFLPIMGDDDVYAYDGQAKLPAGLARRTVESVHRGKLAPKPAQLVGAAWMRFGVAYLLDMHPGHNRRCHCTATEFEVDDFGRVFYTDQGRFRVVVLDTNGNELTSFGRYGNQDAAAGEIAFNWFTGLGVSDRACYVADALNRCVRRIKLTYAAEAMCGIRR